jgi:hypothetical protein
LAAPAPAATTAASPRLTRFVVAQVLQALQQTAAAGAFSPYFAAACATRPVQIVLTGRAYSEDSDAARRPVDEMHHRFLLLLTALLVLAAPAGASSFGLAGYGSDPPPEPKLCTAPLAGTRGVMRTGTNYPDTLCGTRGADRLVAVGGGDSAWGYPGADDFRARNGLPDEIYGGPGVDKGTFDPCDRVMDVEHATRSGTCHERPRRFGAAAVLPYVAPVVECYYAANGDRTLNVLVEPEMRAIDATARIDFQTVAWSVGLLRLTDGGPQFVGQGSWFWDRVYDEQVEASPGNYWRSFKTGQRTFVTYTVRDPGTYVLGVYLHWYATDSSPARDEVAIARAHYGPAENADQSACTFAT